MLTKRPDAPLKPEDYLRVPENAARAVLEMMDSHSDGVVQINFCNGGVSMVQAMPVHTYRAKK